DLGSPPVSQLVISPRDPQGPIRRDIEVDPTLLDVGDHNGSTYFQHQGFVDLVRANREAPDVDLDDGMKSVIMGMAAQRSITEQRMVNISEFTE
ncbi:MAG: gfo/Idh/MocA family oxidoreductase, partial [Planktomarina sp.]